MSDVKNSLEKERELFIKRIEELANRSYSSGIYTFTDFLTSAELSCALSLNHLGFAHPTSFGGADFCERKILRFGDEEEFGYTQDFPISCIEIKPRGGKFSRILTHRDYLGSLMNLGIERSCIGDILLSSNNAYVFCVERMAEYIKETLRRVSHEEVSVRILGYGEELPEKARPKLEEKCVTVASLRLDAVIAAVFNLSRSEAQECVEKGEVFINQREVNSPSRELSSQDTVYVRGNGKFIYKHQNRISRKGKLNISVDIYC